MSHIPSNERNEQYPIQVLKEFFSALDVYCVHASDGTVDFSRRMARYLVHTFTLEQFIEAYLRAWGEGASGIQHQAVVSDEMQQVISLVFDERLVQKIFQGIATGLGKQELLTTVQTMLDHPLPFSLRG